MGYSPLGCKELDRTERLHSLTHPSYRKWEKIKTVDSYFLILVKKRLEK